MHVSRGCIGFLSGVVRTPSRIAAFKTLPISTKTLTMRYITFEAALRVGGPKFGSRNVRSAASPQTEFSNTGNNVDFCPTVHQVANTGNVVNQQGVVQYRSEADDIDFTGSSITIEPSTTSDCTQTIDQAASGG